MVMTCTFNITFRPQQCAKEFSSSSSSASHNSATMFSALVLLVYLTFPVTIRGCGCKEWSGNVVCCHRWQAVLSDEEAIDGIWASSGLHPIRKSRTKKKKTVCRIVHHLFSIIVGRMRKKLATFLLFFFSMSLLVFIHHGINVFHAHI